MYLTFEVEEVQVERSKYILWFLRQANAPFHQVQAPATKVKFLGWIVDTEEMTVAAPPERMEQIRSISRLRGAKVSVRLCQSVAGILEFLASILTFMKAPAGWMQRRAAALVSGAEKCDDKFRQRFAVYMEYVCWNGVTPIRCLETRAEISIYADASGVHGYGATSPQAKVFTMGKWTDVEMEQAFRLKANSSTYLEVMAICIAIATFGLW